MVDCGNCGKKISIFGKRYNVDSVDICQDCNNLKEEKERMEKEENEIKDSLKKGNLQWEYKVFVEKTDAGILNSGSDIKEEQTIFLNKLGKLGWELVSTVPLLGVGQGMGVHGTSTKRVAFIFKRKK